MTKKRARRRNNRERSEGEEFQFGDFNFSTEPEITPGLVPIGDTGFYQSPVEPVDPMNCELWPTSPYCGGTGLTADRLGLEREFSINPCEICLTINPSLVFVSLPPYTICRRSTSPECALPPVPFPDIPSEDLGPESFDNPRRTCAEGTYVLLTDYRDMTHIQRDTREVLAAHVPQDTELGDALKLIYAQSNRIAQVNFQAELDLFGSQVIEVLSDTGPYEDYRSNPYIVCHLVLIRNDGTRQYIKDVVSPGLRNRSRRYEYLCGNRFGRFTTTLSNLINWIDYSFIFDNVFPPCQGAPNLGPLPPPYPLENGDPCCMSCGESEELLRLIYKRLGGDQYPIPVPQSLLANKGGGQKNLQSISEFIHWFVLQFDSITGQFPIEIEVKDSDPTKEGDQRQKLVIPNLAEGVAEILGLSLSSNINTQTLINALIRTLTEAGGAKIHALETRHIAQAIADYLAFDAKEIKTNVGMTFTPGREELDEILQERDQEIPLLNYSDDRDFREEMTDLLQAAGIIRAVFYRKVGQTGDIKQELKDRFKSLIKLGENAPGARGGSDGENARTDFDKFLEDAELGFANTAGISDVLHPYGRNYEQRPKIRELGNTADNTNEPV